VWMTNAIASDNAVITLYWDPHAVQRL
jgi:hypothetical protein